MLTFTYNIQETLCICDRACENQPCEHIKIACFFQLCSVVTYKSFVQIKQINTIDVEFNGESSEVYRKCILIFKQKIFIKI